MIDDSLLIDAGCTTATLHLSAQQKIKDILITHIHLDHVMALATLADNLYGKCKFHQRLERPPGHRRTGQVLQQSGVPLHSAAPPSGSVLRLRRCARPKP
jgi:glyoxylase-like metal-dependent hydrolase (beta-lactamase superfamily II)